MGFLGEMFHPHQEAEKPVIETEAVVPEAAAGSDAAAENEVKPGSVDTVTASADSSTVDLGSMDVSPISGENTGAAEQPESVEAPVDSAIASETEGESAEESSVELESPVDTDEVNISVEPSGTVESTDGDDVSLEGGAPAVSEDTSEKSAEEMLAEWQKEKPGGDVSAESTDESSVEVSAPEADHTVESSVDVSGEKSDDEQAEPEPSHAPEMVAPGAGEGSLAEKLSEEAADEAGKIDEAMAASQATPLTEADQPREVSEPKIRAVSSDIIPNEKPDEVSTELADEASAEATESAEDTPFPELKPEPEVSPRSVDEDRVTETITADSLDETHEDTEIGDIVKVPETVVDGADVHEDRQTFSAEPSVDIESGAAKSAENVVDLAAKRAALVKAKAQLDTAYQDAMDALDEAA